MGLWKLKEKFEKAAMAKAVDGSPRMTFTDFKKLYEMEGSMAENLFQIADENSSGDIDFDEFVLLETLIASPRSTLKLQFKMMDATKDGHISLAEFQSVVKHASAIENFKLGSDSSFIKRHFGEDGKGKLNFAKFCNLIAEMKDLTARAEWTALKPDKNATVSTVSLAKLLIREHVVVPQFVLDNLLRDDGSTRLSWDDFCALQEIFDGIEEIALQANQRTSPVLSRAEFMSSVRGALQDVDESKWRMPDAEERHRNVIEILFGWFDKQGKGEIDKEAFVHTLGQRGLTAVSPQPLKLWQSVVLGGMSSGVGGTVVFPMDKVKTRMMSGQGASVFSAFSAILRNEGARALVRGLGPQLVGIMPEKALKLSAYYAFQQALLREGQDQPEWWQESLAGAGTGVLQVSITNPYEIVKIRLQMQTGKGGPGMVDIVRQLGARGLSQGIGATLLRDVPFNAIYFGAYGELKRLLKPEDRPLPASYLLASGMAAGTIAAGVTTPGDVVKTRMQSGGRHYASVAECVRETYAEGGGRAFLRGLGPRLMIIPPLFGVTLTLFEVLQRRLFPSTVAPDALAHMLPDSCRVATARHQIESLELKLKAVNEMRKDGAAGLTRGGSEK